MLFKAIYDVIMLSCRDFLPLIKLCDLKKRLIKILVNFRLFFEAILGLISMLTKSLRFILAIF